MFCVVSYLYLGSTVPLSALFCVLCSHAKQHGCLLQTPLALRYIACPSILESHHCACAFAILRRPESSIFAALDTEQFKQARELIVSSILATDMKTHFDLQAEIAQLNTAEALQQHNGLLAQALVHAADISNPLKPFDISKRWSDLVVQEFFAQGDRERQEGLPVSANMDRDTTEQAALSVNFCDFIVAPFFVMLSSALPPMKLAVEVLATNRGIWQSRRKKGSKEEEEKWQRRDSSFMQLLSSKKAHDST